MDWVLSGTPSLDSQLRNDLPTLRERSRKLGQENPYFQGFLGMLKNNVLGAEGIQLKNKAKELDQFVGGKIVPGRPDVLANKLIEDAWWMWGRAKYCTTDGKLTWEEVQSLVLETAGTDGECVVRLIFGADNPFGFSIQLIETDRLDTEKNERLSNGNVIRMGVEKDAMGRAVAYWLLKTNPNDNLEVPGTFNYSDRHVRIPASEIVHPFLMRRIGQTRGFPWPAAIMLNLQMLGGYEEAELVAARTAACKAAVLETTGDVRYEGEQANHKMTAEPGVIEQLPQGLTLKPIDWNHPNSAYGEFIKAALRGMAAGLGVSYPNIANDYESVNFSSGRMSQMQEREHWQYLQKWFACQFCDPIYSAWLPTAILSGAINLPLAKVEKFAQPTWAGRRWSWVDPTKEVSAKIDELNAGITSLTRVAQSMGMDRDELLDEIKEDQEAVESRGIVLPGIWQEPPDEMELAKVKAGAAVAEPEDRSVHVSVHQPELKQPLTVNVPESRGGKKRVEITRDEKGLAQSMQLVDEP